MKQVGVAELKARLSEYLRSVRKGTEVMVYDRNEPIARLVPYSQKGPLVVREAVHKYRTLREIPLSGSVKLDVDLVAILLEDRQSEA